MRHILRYLIDQGDESKFLIYKKISCPRRPIPGHFPFTFELFLMMSFRCCCFVFLVLQRNVIGRREQRIDRVVVISASYIEFCLRLHDVAIR